MIFECLDCCKEFEILEPLTKEEIEKVVCPYCGCADILIGDEE